MSVFFIQKFVDNSQHAQYEVININENKSITSNAQTLITRTKVRFSFNLKNVFSITRRRVFKKRSKDKSFKSKESFEKLNQSFRLEIKEHEILLK